MERNLCGQAECGAKGSYCSEECGNFGEVAALAKKVVARVRDTLKSYTVVDIMAGSDRTLCADVAALLTAASDVAGGGHLTPSALADTLNVLELTPTSVPGVEWNVRLRKWFAERSNEEL